MFSFIRTTVAGGLLFILPLMLIVILLEKAVHLLREPIRKLLPMFTHWLPQSAPHGSLPHQLSKGL